MLAGFLAARTSLNLKKRGYPAWCRLRARDGLTVDCRRKAGVPRGTDRLGIADACRSGSAKPNFMHLPTSTAFWVTPILCEIS